MKARAPRAAGFTLLEIIIFSSLTALLGLWVARLLRLPQIMHRQMAVGERERDVFRALDGLVNDLKEADPSSVPWDSLSAANAIAFQKVSFSISSGTYLAPTPMEYRYQPTEGAATGALVRIEDNSPQVILSPIDPPTDNEPLFQADPRLHVIMISVRYHAPNEPPVRIVRRVATRG